MSQSYQMLLWCFILLVTSSVIDHVSSDKSGDGVLEVGSNNKIIQQESRWSLQRMRLEGSLQHASMKNINDGEPIHPSIIPGSSLTKINQVDESKDIDDPIKSSIGSDGTTISISSSSYGESGNNTNTNRDVDAAAELVALWTKESHIAQNEIERLLMGDVYGSLPPIPPKPASPVLQPTPQPIIAPISNQPTQNPTPIFSPTVATPSITMHPITLPSLTGMPIPPSTVSPSISRNIECLNNETAETYLFKQISLLVNDSTILLNPNTAQGLAFNFTLGDELINSNICTYPTIDQRFGLAVFYYATGGPNWFLSAQWLDPSSECSWLGVTCDDDDTVSSLVLPSNNLIGTVPDEISVLYGLTRMELYNNQLSSTIPSGITNLTSIVVLDFEDNRFKGNPLSESILQLTTLEQIFFSSNKFTGTLPDDISRLTLLSSLWLADNEIDGSIPATIGNMTNLQTLILYGNNIVGEIPSELGLLTNMSNLQLYQNVLEGTIPDELYNLLQLNVLRIDNNFLIGTISPIISQMYQLTDLRLNTNYLNGTMPDEISLLTNLRFIIAGTNSFSGTIPNLFTDFQSLQNVDFSGNDFTGTIPDSIFNASNLTLVYLSDNALSGTIPDSYSNPTALIDLYLDSNNLTGTVPEIEDGALSTLTELLLEGNLLTGTIPSSLCALRDAATLENLFTDCGGSNAIIECDFPDCCNRCFEGRNSQSSNSTTRTTPKSRDNRRRLTKDLYRISTQSVENGTTTKYRRRTSSMSSSSSSRRHISHRALINPN